MNRWEETINNQHIQRDISTDVLVVTAVTHVSGTGLWAMQWFWQKQGSKKKCGQRSRKNAELTQSLGPMSVLLVTALHVARVLTSLVTSNVEITPAAFNLLFSLTLGLSSNSWNLRPFMTRRRSRNFLGDIHVPLRLSTILIVFVQQLLVSTILPRLSGVEGGEGSLCLLLSAEVITAFWRVSSSEDAHLTYFLVSVV